MKLSELKLNPDNPRNIKPEKLDKLAQSIKDFPKMMVKRPIVYDENKIIIGGNMRYKAIEKLGMTEIPDEWTSDASDFTPGERQRFIMQDNAEMGEHDWDMVANQYELEDLDAWGIDVPYADSTEEVEEDETPEVSNEPPVSQLGVVYQLGRHRVMCGDSTDFKSTGELLNGRTIDLVFSDPPYGIDVVNDEMVGADFGVAKKGKYSKVINDNTTETAKNFYELVKGLQGGMKIILWGGNYFTQFLGTSDGWIVWDKRGDTGIKNTFADGELAWCSFHTPVRIYTQLWNGMIREGEKEKRVHPTQKPLQTLANIIKDFSEKDNIIYDGFLGSGSTLIACEQTDRICYGMELDEKYLDVIRKRYAKFIGEEDWEAVTPAISGGNQA